MSESMSEPSDANMPGLDKQVPVAEQVDNQVPVDEQIDNQLPVDEQMLEEMLEDDCMSDIEDPYDIYYESYYHLCNLKLHISIH
jgi:hypothetical protein